MPSDAPRTTHETRHEIRSERRDGGMYFILGAIVVALGVLIWMMMGDSSPTVADDPGVSITNSVDAPANDAPPAAEPTAPVEGDAANTNDAPAQVDVAPSAEGTQTGN